MTAGRLVTACPVTGRPVPTCLVTKRPAPFAAILSGTLLVVCAGAVRAQAIVGAPERAAARAHVAYIAETAAVTAGKPTVVELRFHVDPGFHINSHKPASELLIPTALHFGESAVQAGAAEYPRGESFRLNGGEGETLDVYQGEFRVRVLLTAPRGESTLAGTLRYQACDSAACYPPRTLAVSVPVSAK